MKYVFLISLPLYLLDRVTKYWVLHSIDPDQPVVVVPDFFHLVNITNNGAAFGSFKNNNGFFIAISFVALLFAHPWTAFNVADSCICIAVFFFIIHSFRQEKKSPLAV